MKIKILFSLLIACASLTFTSCEDCLKSYSNENVARPTVPDVNGDNPSDEDVYDNRHESNRKGIKSEHTDSVMKKNHTGVGHDQH